MQKKQKNKEFVVVMYLFLFLFLGMIAYFAYFQIFKSEEFINNPYNGLQDLFAERVERGEILTADGYVIAETKVEEDGTEIREYPYSNLFSHVVGYCTNGKSGLENQLNFQLLRSHSFFTEKIINDLVGKKSKGDHVVTTLSYQMQKTAYDALGNKDGAVIVMEPSTGKIIAMVSKPDFNPNTIEENWESLTEEGSTVLYNRATQGQYTPGSIFKMITTVAYYNQNPSAILDFSYDCQGKFVQDGKTIRCASDKKHGLQDLCEAFANSCNGAYAKVALELDITTYRNVCERLLFNKSLPVSFASNPSQFVLTEEDTDATIIETAIGQGETLVSPLHMCMLAAAISQDGELKQPYLWQYTVSEDGALVDTKEEKSLGQIFTKEEAILLQTYMRAVVSDGTASKLKSDNYEAFGKTGTAQVSDSKNTTNAWFVGYATYENDKEIAIAVVVEGGESGSKSAVPIAKKIFEAYSLHTE